MKTLQGIARVVEKISSVGSALAVVVIGISVLLINAEVLNRMTGFARLSFAEEFTGYCLLFIALIAGAQAIKKGDFIRLYIFSNQWPQRIQYAVQALSYAIGVLIFAVFLKQCIDMVQESLLYGAVSQSVFKTPLWIPQLVIVIGLVIMLLQVIINFIRSTYYIYRPPAPDKEGARVGMNIDSRNKLPEEIDGQA